jgi:hypothetical protein
LAITFVSRFGLRANSTTNRIQFPNAASLGQIDGRLPSAFTSSPIRRSVILEATEATNLACTELLRGTGLANPLRRFRPADSVTA